MQDFQKRLQDLDKMDLSEKQEAQLESCLKKFEVISSMEKPDQDMVKNLGDKITGLEKSVEAQNNEESGSESNGNESPDENETTSGPEESASDSEGVA